MDNRRGADAEVVGSSHQRSSTIVCMYVVEGRIYVYQGLTDEQVVDFDSALAADIFLENDITCATTI